MARQLGAFQRTLSFWDNFRQAPPKQFEVWDCISDSDSLKWIWWTFPQDSRDRRLWDQDMYSHIWFSFHFISFHAHQQISDLQNVILVRWVALWFHSHNTTSKTEHICVGEYGKNDILTLIHSFVFQLLRFAVGVIIIIIMREIEVTFRESR
jgi:hypothetical protein